MKPTLIVTRDEKEIVCELSARFQRPEPENGIFSSYWEDLIATDIATGEQVDLTADEQVDADSELYEAQRKASEEAYLSRHGV